MSFRAWSHSTIWITLLRAIAMLCTAARAPTAAAGCPPTVATPARAGRTTRCRAPARPRASHASFSDGELNSSSAPSAYTAPDARLQQTIADIDALLGIDVQEAAREAEQAAAAGPSGATAASELAVPAEWAHLPAEELVRRQKLVSGEVRCDVSKPPRTRHDRTVNYRCRCP